MDYIAKFIICSVTSKNYRNTAKTNIGQMSILKTKKPASLTPPSLPATLQNFITNTSQHAFGYKMTSAICLLERSACVAKNIILGFFLANQFIESAERHNPSIREAYKRNPQLGRKKKNTWGNGYGIFPWRGRLCEHRWKKPGNTRGGWSNEMVGPFGEGM